MSALALAVFIALMAVTVVAALLAARAVLDARVNAHIEEELGRDASELRSLARQVDSATGQVFGEDARDLFSAYVERHTPAEGETILTFVDGRLFLHSAGPTDYLLDEDEGLTSQWADLEEPSRGAVETPAGLVEFVALPVERDDATQGVFVSTQSRDLQSAPATALVAAGAAGLAALLLGLVVALVPAAVLQRRAARAPRRLRHQESWDRGATRPDDSAAATQRRWANAMAPPDDAARRPALHLESLDFVNLAHQIHSRASGLAPRRWELDVRGEGTLLADEERLTEAALALAADAAERTRPGDAIIMGFAIEGRQARLWVVDDEGRPPLVGRLAAVVDVVEAHGGRLDYDDSAGADVPFSVVLPSDGVRGRRLAS